MRYFYWLVSLILLITAVAIFQLKGYLNVRNFVSNRSDVSTYLSQRYTFKSFFMLNKDEISELVKYQFTDIKDAKVKKNLLLTVDVVVESRAPFAQVGGGGFISAEGVFFLSNSISKDTLPKFLAKDLVPAQQVLSKSQIRFIQDLTEEYSIFSGEIIKPFHFVLNVKDLEIESEKSYDNLEFLVPVVLNIINEDSDGRPKKILLLDSRVVVKK
jgi:hypothetical protein